MYININLQKLELTETNNYSFTSPYFLVIEWLEHQDDNHVEMIPRLRMHGVIFSRPLYTIRHSYRYLYLLSIGMVFSG
jgi:hypothetical protein